MEKTKSGHTIKKQTGWKAGKDQNKTDGKLA